MRRGRSDGGRWETAPLVDAKTSFSLLVFEEDGKGRIPSYSIDEIKALRAILVCCPSQQRRDKQIRCLFCRPERRVKLARAPFPIGKLGCSCTFRLFYISRWRAKKIQSYLRTDRFSNPGRVLATIKHVIRVEVQLGFDLTSYLLRSMVLEPDADSR